MRSHARTPSGSPQNSLTRFCMPSTSKATCKVHIRVCNRLGDAAGVRRQMPVAMLLWVCALGCVASGQGWGMPPLLAGGGGRGAGARVRDDAGGDAPGVPAVAGARRCLGLPSQPGCSSPPLPLPTRVCTRAHAHPPFRPPPAHFNISSANQECCGWFSEPSVFHEIYMKSAMCHCGIHG